MTKNPRISTAMADSRARLGQKQREKSRTAIVEAAVKVFQTKSPDATVVEDLVAEAGVGRGTFYNHFQDMEEVRTAVALKLTDELNETISMDDKYKNIPDPAERICVAMHHFFRRTVTEPNWARLIVKVGLHEGPLNEMLREAQHPDLRAGLAAGRFAKMHEETASVLLFGATLFGMLSILDGRMSGAHAKEIVCTTMRGLGIPPEEASLLASKTFATAHRRGRST